MAASECGSTIHASPFISKRERRAADLRYARMAGCKSREAAPRPAL